jgi:hypothetical protein
MHSASENVPGHGRAEDGTGDIVENAGQHEHDAQKHQCAEAAMRQILWTGVGRAAELEMARNQFEASQQQRQID